MIDPIYTDTLIIGGSAHKYAFNAFPTELLADQSLNVSITITKADGSPFDLSTATAVFYCTARNVAGLVPTNLGNATLSDSGSGTVDTVSIVLAKDGIPDFLGSYSPTRTGSSVFYFQIQDADSFIQIYQYVNVTAGDFSGDGSGSIETPSSSLLYTPAVGTDWPDPDPTTVEGGLDGLASRVQTIEDNPASGDMTKAVYDPQAINGDAFDRNNMSGTQLASTISDFTATVNANTNVTGSITAHSDVSDAGSGAIISSAERTDLSTSIAHVSSTANPHNVTPAQVGNTTPQWYASHIQTTPIDDPALATDQYVATFDLATNSVKWVQAPGAGGGETNDLQLDVGATGQDIRITKTGSNVITKGFLGTNNISVSTVNQDIVIDLPDSAEGVKGGIAIANTADVTTGTDDTKAITPAKLEAKLGDYQKKSLVIKTTSGAYSLLAGDVGTLVKVDNTLTLPVLTAGYNCMIYNTLGTAVTLTPSGTTIDNTTDTKIAPNGSISVIYLDTTTIIIDGNTEA